LAKIGVEASNPFGNPFAVDAECGSIYFSVRPRFDLELLNGDVESMHPIGLPNV
jgi:hypothetical protein